MTTAPMLAKQCVQTYAAIKLVEQKLQEKLDKLLETRPFYQLFDVANDHPYAALPAHGQQLRQEFLNLYAGIADWDVTGRTISDEMAQIKARQEAEGTDADLNVAELSQLAACTVDVDQAAEQLVKLFSKATWIWSFCDNKGLKELLIAKFGKKGAANNAEVPLLNIAPECKDAVKEVKKLSKLLMGTGDGAKTIRTVLSVSPDTVIAHLLK